MRILYLVNGFDPGGAEHGLATLLDHDAFEGHDLRIVALCRGRGELARQMLEKIDSSLLVFVSQDERLTMRACLKGVIAIITELRGYKPDVLVCSLKQANVVGRLAAMLFPDIRLISFEHTTDYTARRFAYFYRLLLFSLSWRVDEVWADCRETLVQTRRYFTSRDRSEQVVPLVVANSDTRCKEDYSIDSTLKLVAAGRLVERKNYDLLIDAVADLRRRGVEVDLDVYGAGDCREKLLERIEAHGIQGAVIFHGYRSDWIQEASEADLFLNLSESEGFCIVVAEAMCAGLPVIAVDVGGIRDYGEDEVNMLKLPAADREQICSSILRLQEDPPLRESIGRRARLDILETYSPKKLRQNMQEILSRTDSP